MKEGIIKMEVYLSYIVFKPKVFAFTAGFKIMLLKIFIKLSELFWDSIFFTVK